MRGKKYSVQVGAIDVVRKLSGEVGIFCGPFLQKRAVTFGVPLQIAFDRSGTLGTINMEMDVTITSAIISNIFIALPFKRLKDDLLVYISLSFG
jgi:hypothetical protein